MASLYIKDKQKLRGIRYMLLSIAVINAIDMIILNIISDFFDNPIPVYINALIIGLTAYVVPIVIYARINSITVKTASERFKLKSCDTSILLFVALLGVAWQFVMVVINLPINIVTGVSETYSMSGPGELFADIVLIAIIPAFFEEFLFRGIVDGSMEEMNPKAGMIFSSVMFAILHGDVYGFAGYLLMGLILSIIARRTGSLYGAMVFHLMNNITALLLAYYNADLVYEPILTIGLFASGIVIFAVMFTLFIKATKKQKCEKKIKTSQLLGQSFVNVPILLSIAAVVITNIIVEMV